MNRIRPTITTLRMTAVALAALTFLVAVADCSAQAQNEGAGDALASPVFIAPRIVQPVDDTKLASLRGNTHPMARSEFDKGPLDTGKLLERMILVLKRSPEQENALAAFNQRQYDPDSPDFHHWLLAEEFGQLYGPSDTDLTAVKNWLQNHASRSAQLARVACGLNLLERWRRSRRHSISKCADIWWMGRSTSPMIAILRFPPLLRL